MLISDGTTLEAADFKALKNTVGSETNGEWFQRGVPIPIHYSVELSA